MQGANTAAAANGLCHPAWAFSNAADMQRRQCHVKHDSLLPPLVHDAFHDDIRQSDLR